MRKLMWFTVGFGVACAYCAYTWTCEGLILPAICFLGIFGAMVFAGKTMEKLYLAAAVSLGIAFGCLWFQGYHSILLSPAEGMDGKTTDATLHCTDFSKPTDYGMSVEGFVYVDGIPCKARFYVNTPVEMEPGDMLTGQFRLRTTWNRDKGNVNYLQGKGIFLLGYQKDEAQLVKSVQKPLWAYPAVLRRNVTDILSRYFSGDTGAFATALLLGDRSNLDYELTTAFQRSGIMHIIAVSGLHVTILFTLINLLCLKRRWLVALLGIPALLLFAAMAGFTPSVNRACIMQCLMIGAALFDREYDGPTELAFASLVMMLVNPLVITSVSFQLSVGCMIGIFLFQKRLYDWMCGKLKCEGRNLVARCKRFVAGSVSMTLSAISLTTPLSAYYFGAVSIVGILTNLLTLWAVSIIFYGIILVCVLSIVAPGIAGIAASGVSAVIRFVLLAARLMGEIPIAAVYTRSIYILAWLVFSYVLLMIFLLSETKRPGILVGCIAFTLVLSLTASWLEPKTDDCRMTVLDVGQGQCILLQSDGKTYVVDCGGSYDTDAANAAAETLLSQGIRHIDGLILTHYDRDHAGGAMLLAQRMPIESIFAPSYPVAAGEINPLTEDGAAVTDIMEETRISYGDTEIVLFPSDVPEDDNEGSLAVLFRSGNCDILITGDRSGFGERLLMKQTNLPDLDILVAGHHGSKNATCEELLAATMPEIVVISVGENSYGHPDDETLERLERYGCRIYRTDLDGTVIFRR